MYYLEGICTNKKQCPDSDRKRYVCFGYRRKYYNAQKSCIFSLLARNFQLSHWLTHVFFIRKHVSRWRQKTIVNDGWWLTSTRSLDTCTCVFTFVLCRFRFLTMRHYSIPKATCRAFLLHLHLFVNSYKSRIYYVCQHSKKLHPIVWEEGKSRNDAFAIGKGMRFECVHTATDCMEHIYTWMDRVRWSESAL